MVKKAVLALCIFAVLPLLVFGQVNTVLKLNPLSLGVATLNVQAEQRLNDRFSAQLGIYGGGSYIPLAASALSGQRLRHFGLTPELRFHTQFNKVDFPEGFFFAGYLRYRRIVQTYLGPVEDPDQQAQEALIKSRRNNIGWGALLGYSFLWGDHFVLDAFLGPQFSLGRRKVELRCSACTGNEYAVPVGLDRAGLDLRAGIGVGYAF